MPSVICFGVINANTSQQNSGVFIGEIICGGWDANQKQNQGHGSVYGFCNVIVNQWNATLDNFEAFDGFIADQDFKPLAGMNV
ncbi:hypothetical protein JI721_12495 [Alicyclobacillus cycloheptanicus]|uniref:Spore germination protein gerPA/gerPF n=1 Tax=Alicyclobacillus cycloheptanicus TaxID=1457 RepID=A0ABT9XEW0_9BACL|nr:hypothetical protein [Alicyclobacillus cycloheptanicus]MDQ0188826.1 hypothetical protein [Alicyclobacillus cycloheptanicus]WDM00527.1 hypothetical protein JI721_12495 [Alicyclobacillus cycloheptanicus]